MTINNVIDMLRAENRDEVPEKLVAFWCSEVDMSLREMLGDGNFAGYSYPEDGDVDLRIPSPWDTAYFFTARQGWSSTLEITVTMRT